MRSYFLPVLIALPVCMAFMLPVQPVQNKTAVSVTEDSVKITWITFEEAVEKSKTEPRKILIDVYTDWCGWCKVMDKTTFTNQVVAQYVNEYYYAVKFNAEQKADVIFGADTFKFVPYGKNGYHELAAALTDGQLSYPTIVYLNDDFTRIQTIPGYQNPENLEPVIKFFGSNSFKTTSWEDYMATFKSEIVAATPESTPPSTGGH